MSKLIPGLYSNEYSLIYTWDELVEEGLVRLDGTKITNVFCDGYSLIISDDITKLTADCFFQSNIKKVLFGKNLSQISDSTFDNCKIIEINVVEDNPYFSSLDGILFNKDKSILVRYPEDKAETKYTIPYSVKKIDVSAFYKNQTLQTIEIYNNKIELQDYCFSDMPKLTKLYLPKNITYAGDILLSKCNSDITVYYCGTEEDFKQIKGSKNFFDWNCMTKENIEYGYEMTLDNLIETGRTIREINKILKINELR